MVPAAAKKPRTASSSSRSTTCPSAESGRCASAPSTRAAVADARRALDLRIWGAYTAVKHGAPRLREGGSIVLTSGSAGPRPGPGWGVGALICSGIEGWARAMALELAPLRVNVVRPGVIRTDLWDSMSEADRAGLYEGVAAQLPVSRVGEAEDVAAAYLYLMANAHSTGDIVTVDGGTLLV